MNQTVLVVDDMQRHVDTHVAALQGWGLTVVTASTLEELAAQYSEHRSDLAAIILDGCVPGDEVNTYDFIAQVKADGESGTFSGILMAASSIPGYRQSMVNAGCTHQAPKETAAMQVLDLLTTAL